VRRSELARMGRERLLQPDYHQRQELSRRRVRDYPGPGGPGPAATSPQGRTRPYRHPVLPRPCTTIESIFDTYKGQLNLEDHGGRTSSGILVRVLQRILALTTAIWHNDHTGQPIKRSLLAYDH
jgi:hypothetical protein